jgi:hypothetical protein
MVRKSDLQDLHCIQLFLFFLLRKLGEWHLYQKSVKVRKNIKKIAKSKGNIS